MSVLKRFVVLTDNKCAVRDTLIGTNYNMISFKEAVTLCALLNQLHEDSLV